MCGDEQRGSDIVSALERFLRYVKIDTKSDEKGEGYPSTEKQKELLDLLYRELRTMGVPDVRQDKEYACVYAVLPSNQPQKTIPAVGFIAHVDTADAMSGANVNPRVIENYDGGDILLNEKEGIRTRAEDFPEMKELKGKRLVVTDGTTLLGADDKAGVTEIMEMVQYFTMHPEIAHGNICVAFTADEEIGRGVDHFDINAFGAHYAYTVDGGALGEISCENFNAADAKVTFHGRSVHPGDAKDKMINALTLQQEFDRMLPGQERPEHTRGHEGFYHLTTVHGTVEKAVASYIIRDHDDRLFETRKKTFLDAAAKMNQKYSEGTVVAESEDVYYNMKGRVDAHPVIMETALLAMKETGIIPKIEPIRGGTDGARLSFRGLPCPNLCTGGGNFHGKHEYLCIDDMEKIVELLVRIVILYSKG